jgi:hypothetical protein
MIAVFLKTPDGAFDFRQIIILLFCMAMVFFVARLLYRGLTTGRIMFGLGKWGSPICYAERKKSPVGFWCVVIFYFLGIAMFSTIAIAFCFLGLLGKMPD